jgi:deoxyribodipyrimidine photolyase
MYLFNRDLRIDNNNLLKAYQKKDGKKLYVCIIDERNKHQEWRERVIKSIDLPIKILRGKFKLVLSDYIKKKKVKELYYNKDYIKDDIVKDLTEELNIKLQLGDEFLLHPPQERPLFVFTKFYEKFRKVPKIRSIIGDNSYRIDAFAALKNRTKISDYINVGVITAREAYARFGKERRRELIWRDFYYNVHPFQAAKYDEWARGAKQYKISEKKRKYFKAWCRGDTGYEWLDANMRELNQTGNMCNHGRLLAANFLIKILGIDWRYGEEYFAKKLIDYDGILNMGNWMWVAGIGVSHEPIFRVYSPDRHLETYDPDHTFIKKYGYSPHKIINFEAQRDKYMKKIKHSHS